MLNPRKGRTGSAVTVSAGPDEAARTRSERGQALAETAVFSVLLVIIAYGLLSWVPVYRARSVANTAAYGCTQFISQSSNPGRARWMGETAAWETLNGDWSGAAGVEYGVEVVPPSGPGQAGVCAVSYRTPTWFGGLLGTESQESVTWYASRGERWKARWR